jgi:hypothetical protein
VTPQIRANNCFITFLFSLFSFSPASLRSPNCPSSDHAMGRPYGSLGTMVIGWEDRLSWVTKVAQLISCFVGLSVAVSQSLGRFTMRPMQSPRRSCTVCCWIGKVCSLAHGFRPVSGKNKRLHESYRKRSRISSTRKSIFHRR